MARRRLGVESAMFVVGVGGLMWLVMNHLQNKNPPRQFSTKTASEITLAMGEAECRANGGFWEGGKCISRFARHSALGVY